jgi:thiol:disulfide interchange protein DsbA
MNRREFSLQTFGTAAGAFGLGMVAVSPSQALAQGAPVEGTHYFKLSQSVPVSAPAGKVEVLEFFWYGCPHCSHFEPGLAAWSAKLPADVVFRRVPVVLRENPGAIHQRLFYALDALGLLPSMHVKVFHALHEEGLRLDTPETIGDYMAKNGIDKAKFLGTMESFGVQSKCRQARALADAYKLDGVPTVGVGGRYFTSVGLNGSNEKTLATVNVLIDKARKSK